MPADVFSRKARHEPISARSHNDVSVAHCLSADSIFELDPIQGFVIRQSVSVDHGDWFSACSTET